MKKQNKVLWWLTAVVIVITAVFITLKSGWHFIKKDLAKEPQQKSVIKPLLQDELKRMIIAASDSLYQVQFSSFVLNIDSGIGLIKGIQLTADSNVYKRLQAQHKAPNMMMNMAADSVFINHFEFKKTNDGKQLVVDNVLIQNPDFHIDYYPQPYNDTTTDSSNSLLTTAVKKLMQLLAVKQVKMNHLNVEMLNHTNSSTRKTALHNIDIVMNGVDVKKERKSDTSESANTVITVANYQLTTADKLYTVAYEQYANQSETKYSFC